jgi:hypothetical protein
MGKQSESGMSSKQQEERAAVCVNKRGGQESRSRVFVIGSAGKKGRLSRVSVPCLDREFTRTELLTAVMYDMDTSFGIREPVSIERATLKVPCRAFKAQSIK